MIYFFGDDGLQRYDMLSFGIIPIAIPFLENAIIRDVRVELGKAYVLLEEETILLSLERTLEFPGPGRPATDR